MRIVVKNHVKITTSVNMLTEEIGRRVSGRRRRFQMHDIIEKIIWHFSCFLLSHVFGAFLATNEEFSEL